jgi:hypothetical protein
MAHVLHLWTVKQMTDHPGVMTIVLKKMLAFSKKMSTVSTQAKPHAMKRRTGENRLSAVVPWCPTN